MSIDGQQLTWEMLAYMGNALGGISDYYSLSVQNM